MDAIGSSTKPIYIDANGAAKPLGTKGSATKPIYMGANGFEECALTSETWTLEALDGTTVTKKVNIQS